MLRICTITSILHICMRSSRKPPRSLGARAKKKVQAGCIYASNYIIPFVEIRGGGSIPTGACVACLPALLPRAPWSPLTPLSFSVENPQRPKEEKKKRKETFFESEREIVSGEREKELSLLAFLNSFIFLFLT